MAADAFQALGEPTRLTIVEMLAHRGELSASQICDEFSVSAPAISQHLKVLREAHVVLVTKHAQQRIYRINPTSMQEIEGWAHKMAAQWNERFDALEQVLREEQSQEQKEGSLKHKRIRRK